MEEKSSIISPVLRHEGDHDKGNTRTENGATAL
jgi:hypothetical protein